MRHSFTAGVITTNQIPLTTIENIFKKVTEAEFQTIGPLYLHALWYLPFTNNLRKHTVTYHFSEVYSGNCQIHTKCQLQYLHPPHRVDVKVSALVTTVTYMHQSQPMSHSLRIYLMVHLEL